MYDVLDNFENGSSRPPNPRSLLNTRDIALLLSWSKIPDNQNGLTGNRWGDANETHFNIKVVSAKFDGQSLLKRHRMVYDLLGDELKSGLHAISIVARTPQESAPSNA
uniref:Protein BOLA1, chloroplastic n=1 Tax=Ananas comosus var. bracteatus TaxID=296719 RepID=A0A6V7QLB3_ANACO|nr:unnamed protein product [Ananas comosus var. bracteatus]